MPGSVEIMIDGQPAKTIDLPVADITRSNGKLAYGDVVKLTVHNTGNTDLMSVTVGLTGEGATNACLGLEKEPTSSKPVRVSSQLKPGQSEDFWARACYRRGEAEDGKDVTFFVTATSMG